MNDLTDVQLRELERLEKHGSQWDNTPKRKQPTRNVARRQALKLKKLKSRAERQQAIAQRRRHGGL